MTSRTELENFKPPETHRLCHDDSQHLLVADFVFRHFLLDDGDQGFRVWDASLDSESGAWIVVEDGIVGGVQVRVEHA